MCGIAGIIDTVGKRRVSIQAIQQMVDVLRHRGPDGSQVFAADNYGLGFARLSIIDLQDGMQPMRNEDGSILSVCNGELYNYKELRQKLEGRGHVLKTKSDCEILPHLYEEHGFRIPELLNGQFAFGIIDSRQNLLFAARDHFGIAPFFYTMVDGLFIFASEIKAILKCPSVPREVDLIGLDQVLTFPGLISPRTMFKGIHSLPSGYSITVGIGREPCLSQYWDLEYPPESAINPYVDETSYEEKLASLLEKSIKRRLVADVPVGMYLSGGLDSSLIGAIVKNICPSLKRDSFSIDFADRELSESKYQWLVARHLGTNHHPKIMEGPDIADSLPKVIYHCECPLKETFNTAAFALSEAVSESGIKVVLAGQGADELFAGYVGYRFDRFNQLEQNSREDWTPEEKALGLEIWGDDNFIYEKHHHAFRKLIRQLYSANLRNQSLAPDCLTEFVINKERLRDLHPLHKRSYVDMKLRLCDHLLGDHGDRMTFANGVEARFPFLDQELVDFARIIPPQLKLKGFEEKYILKQIARSLVPPEIVQREKFGFAAPGSPYLIIQNNEYINEFLSFSHVKKDGYFDPNQVEFLRKQYTEPGFQINVPFDSDLLAVVITFGIFREIFELPRLG